MEPQTKYQVIAQCILDLAGGYIHKYGYDSFVKQCADAVLKYDKNSLAGLMLKANYESQRLDYIANQIDVAPRDTIKAHAPRAYKLLEERNKLYSRIDATGYREMPKEAYEDWLRFMNEEKEHQENSNSVLQLIK
jgi:hypothetical protein